MDDLISRSELLKMFPVNLEAPFWHVTGIRAAIGAVDAVDAVPVVRCENCYWKSAGGYCRRYGHFAPDGFFCADGKPTKST